tara:strand:- start:209 stop:643 length:435 start_codon:yes stop_codon:yes gene_type:complete
MKTCSTCKEELPFENFSIKGKGSKGQTLYSSKCRECNKAYQREHYKKNKKYYAKKARGWEKEYKHEAYSYLREKAKDGCVHCGEQDFRCLQFNHIERSTKIDSVSSMVRDNKNLSVIKEEVDKCEVLCANCHFKVTAGQFNWYK